MEPEECAVLQTAFANRKKKNSNNQNHETHHMMYNYTYIPMVKHNMIYLKQSALNDQQIHLKKKNLRMLIIFLCAFINFGNSFCGNSAAPLQREIQQEMNINESDFNLFFSIRSFANLFLPFFLAGIIKRIGIKKCCMILCAFCCLGQMLFTIGISGKNYTLCLIGRLVFGFSDSMTVFQQTILCYWFDNNSLPFVFGILLFLVKVIRALNDNFAPMFFNATQSLEAFFWIGFAVTVASLISAYYLTLIHEAVIESTQHIKEKSDKERIPLTNEDQSSSSTNMVLPENESLGEDFYHLAAISLFGFAVIHSFYPNLSYLLQIRFGYNNEQAGHLASLPYIIASFATPLFGSFISKVGEKHNEKLLLVSIAALFIVQLQFTMMNDIKEGEEPKRFVLVPISIFGVAHAMFATLQGPSVSFVIRSKSLLPKAFSYIKIADNLGISILTFLAGYIRVKTNGFRGVHVLFAFISLLGTAIAYNYYQKKQRDRQVKYDKLAKDADSKEEKQDYEKVSSKGDEEAVIISVSEAEHRQTNKHSTACQEDDAHNSNGEEIDEETQCTSRSNNKL